MRYVWMAAALIAVATSAGAQTGSNVVAPRAENQVNSINQSITSQGQTRAIQQQNQFETNSIRSQLTQPAPSPMTPGTSGIVAPGQR